MRTNSHESVPNEFRDLWAWQTQSQISCQPEAWHYRLSPRGGLGLALGINSLRESWLTQCRRRILMQYSLDSLACLVVHPEERRKDNSLWAASCSLCMYNPVHNLLLLLRLNNRYRSRSNQLVLRNRSYQMPYPFICQSFTIDNWIACFYESLFVMMWLAPWTNDSI